MKATHVPNDLLLFQSSWNRPDEERAFFFFTEFSFILCVFAKRRGMFPAPYSPHWSMNSKPQRHTRCDKSELAREKYKKINKLIWSNLMLLKARMKHSCQMVQSRVLWMVEMATTVIVWMQADDSKVSDVDGLCVREWMGGAMSAWVSQEDIRRAWMVSGLTSHPLAPPGWTAS